MKVATIFFFVFAMSSRYSQAQLWAPILNPERAIDWSNAGVGGIPGRTVNCRVLTSSATVAQINSALASCPDGQSVLLKTGRYSITGTINIPSNVTLRGDGADKTILNASGTGGGSVINLGSGGPPWAPPTISILRGVTAGSRSIVVSNSAGISVGKLLSIGEINNPSFVTSRGSEGVCKWCDLNWSKEGSYSRGQVVMVTGVSGDTISIAPGLYSAYTKAPMVAPFSATAHAGVEDLQVHANNTGYSTNFELSACAYCWIKGVESNYTDGDHVEVYFGYHDEIRDSYFSNAYLHSPGLRDSDIVLGSRTSESLVENNIIERTHIAIMLEWGAAGNVVGYNYTMGEFDSGSINAVIGGISYHGSHPQFNLLEGNVVTKISLDSAWGSSSHTTAYRNWVVGTNRVCSPTSGRGTVSCSGTNGHYGFQAARAFEISYLATLGNFVGNVLGSANAQALKGFSKPLGQKPSAEYPAARNYDAAAYGWSLGYGEASDDGAGSGCTGGTPPCHLSGSSANNLFHGNYNNANGSIVWAGGLTKSLPASFYLVSRPAWWGSIPYPATGPDVTGGTGAGRHSYGNPAQWCYTKVMGRKDGGAGGPLAFKAKNCYGQ